MLCSCGGVVLGFVAGHYLDYHEIPLITMIFPITFFVLYSLMPETPYYLMKINRLEDAEKSLRFYRNVSNDAKSDNKEFEYELVKLKDSHQQMLLQYAANDAKEKLTISDFGNFEIGQNYWPLSLFNIVNYV